MSINIKNIIVHHDKYKCDQDNINEDLHHLNNTNLHNYIIKTNKIKIYNKWLQVIFSASPFFLCKKKINVTIDVIPNSLKTSLWTCVNLLLLYQKKSLYSQYKHEDN